MENKLSVIPQRNELISILDSVEIAQVSNTLGKIAQFQSIVQKSLKSGHDFGNVGGVTKPTLLKPGAEKIQMLMGLTTEYDIVEKIEDYDKGIFAYTIKCSMYKNGMKITEGVGSCNSKEDKYRWRWVKEDELPIGQSKDTVKSKVDNYGRTKYRVENEDIYSQANTVLKMAKKRAQIDATLTVASLSEIFTQDVEDLKEFEQSEQVETMSSNDALNLKVNFGKHKGKTLKVINDEAPDYIEWLAKNGNDPVMRKACEMIMKNTLNKLQNQKNSKSDYAGTPFTGEPDGFAPIPDEGDIQY